MATFDELLAQIQASAQKAKGGMTEAQALAAADPRVREILENPDKLMQGLIPFGLQSPTGFGPVDIMYSLGMPIYDLSGNSRSGMTNVYRDNYNANLERGVPPTTGFPSSWGGTAAGGGGGSKPSANTGSLPQWWLDWYQAEGKQGGKNPMPQGLL